MSTHRALSYRRPTKCLVETVPQRARKSGVSTLTIRRAIQRGSVRAIRIGGSWRIPAADEATVAELPSQCSVRQVANALNVSELTVRRWIASDEIPALKQGRFWTITRSTVADLLLGPAAPAGRSA